VDAELDKADLALDEWMKQQLIADTASTRHKHQTAAQIKLIADEQGVTKAKEAVIASDQWFERQVFCDEAAIKAQGLKMRFEQAIRRWETARSLFSAGRKVP